MQNILMIHQGSELYGSDRSFLSSLESLRENNPDAYIEVHLPCYGPLVEYIENFSSKILFNNKGHLRKAELKSNPFSSICGVLGRIFEYSKLMKKFDLVYINTVVCISAILGASLNKNIKIFIHVREIGTGPIKYFFKYLLKFSKAKIIFNSRATQLSFALNGHVLHNGVDALGPSQINNSLKPYSKIKILIMGRINSWKGQDFLVKSLAQYNNRDLIELRVVGDVYPGTEHFKTSLLFELSKANLNAAVLDFSDVPYEHFVWSDYVIVPSTLPEPFGRVAIEGMSVSRPIIAANHGGLSEIVVNGETGFLFTPNDKESLIKVFDKCLSLDENEYKEICSNAYRRYADLFSLDAYKEGLINVIK